LNIYQIFLDYKARGEKGLFVLIDPDKGEPAALREKALSAQKAGAAAVLAGGSHLNRDDFDAAMQAMKSVLSIPLVLFPGGATQVSQYADAILFLSLISGRNPQYLIGEHVTAAPKVKKLGIEVISTAYMLIESGITTAVEFISDTRPIPRSQVGIATAHAMAAEMLGMKMVYLEAGSGAINPVPVEMISAVRKSIDLPLIVGGGFKTPEQASSAVKAGADFAVVGNALEGTDNDTLLTEMVRGIKAVIAP